MVNKMIDEPLITPRLKVIASMIRKGHTAADIGTDHAYLPIWLVKNNICRKVLATDINKGPILKAKQNIKKYGYEENIKTVLSNGLEKLLPDDADDIIIAGMGGELIAQIIDVCKWIRNEKYNFVLQPMTKKEELRKYLSANGFTIYNEQLCSEDERLYVIIAAKYDGVCKDIDDTWALLGERLYEKHDPLFIKLLDKETAGLVKKIAGLEKSIKPDEKEIQRQKVIYMNMLRLKEELSNGKSC